MEINPEFIDLFCAYTPSSQGHLQAEETMVQSEGSNVVPINPQSHGINGMEGVIIQPQGFAVATAQPQPCDSNPKNKGKMVAHESNVAPIVPQPSQERIHHSPNLEPRKLIGKASWKSNWTSELHQKFVDAIGLLGGPVRAKPKKILKLMNTDEVDLDHVRSYLQKYRYDLRKSGESSVQAPTKTSGGESGNRAKSTTLVVDLVSSPESVGDYLQPPESFDNSLVPMGVSYNEPMIQEGPCHGPNLTFSVSNNVSASEMLGSKRKLIEEPRSTVGSVTTQVAYSKPSHGENQTIFTPNTMSYPSSLIRPNKGVTSFEFPRSTDSLMPPIVPPVEANSSIASHVEPMLSYLPNDVFFPSSPMASHFEANSPALSPMPSMVPHVEANSTVSPFDNINASKLAPWSNNSHFPIASATSCDYNWGNVHGRDEVSGGQAGFDAPQYSQVKVTPREDTQMLVFPNQQLLRIEDYLVDNHGEYGTSHASDYKPLQSTGLVSGDDEETTMLNTEDTLPPPAAPINNPSVRGGERNADGDNMEDYLRILTAATTQSVNDLFT